jgi:hypothetical protein
VAIISGSEGWHQHSGTHLDTVCDQIGDDLAHSGRGREVERKIVVRTTVSQHGNLLG